MIGGLRTAGTTAPKRPKAGTRKPERNICLYGNLAYQYDVQYMKYLAIVKNVTQRPVPWPEIGGARRMKASNLRGAGGRERTVRRTVAIAAATTLASFLAVGPASAAPAPASASAAAGPAATTAARTLTLINGDRVTVTATRFGGIVAGVARAAAGGIGGALVRLDLGGKAFQIPADALPYLNRGLSPALFELSSLAAAESAGRLPVQVSYHGGLPSLPGVTITSSRGGTARGYLTAASATKFGAALARQFAADHARGSYGADGMFAGGVSIGLPGQTAAAAARPHYVMHTLTVTGTDLAGHPDTGDLVSVFNVDNLLKFGDPVETSNVFYDGSVKFSVPAGHYMAIGTFFDTSATTITAFRTVILPQFTVAGDTTVAVDEPTATNQVQMVTPQPAVTQDATFTIYRGTGNGDLIEDSFDAGNVPLWTNETTQPPTVGTLQTAVTGYLTSPSGASPRYDYNLVLAGTGGVIGPQRYVVTAGSLATTSAGYFQDGRSTGGWMPLGFFGFQEEGLLSADIFAFALPQSLDQYFSAGPSVIWTNAYYQRYATLSGGQTDSGRTFSPGETATQNWNAYPLHPGPDVNLLGAANPFFELPSASRAGNTLTLVVTPFGDNTVGHTGSGYSPGIFGTVGSINGSYLLRENGKKIAAGNAAALAAGSPDLFLQATLGSKPGVIRFVLTATRTGYIYRLSTATRTVWTWHTGRRPGARLPAGWTCADGTQRCAVQPMMTLLYDVSGLAIDGVAPAGQQQIQLTVGRLQLAPVSRITGATVAVSVNGGATWQPATVTPAGGGTFNVTFTAPPGAFVSLRVHAADAAGDEITETITRGYKTAA